MDIEPNRLRIATATALAGGALFALYLGVSFAPDDRGLLLRYSSGIYDMDVSRVVADVASPRRAYRSAVHPLQKLLVSPVGEWVNTRVFDGRDRLAAAKLLIAAVMALYAVTIGVFTAQLTGGSWSAGAAAGLLTGFSFSSLLAATVPESAAFASLGGVVPLLYLHRRRNRAFSWGEAGIWAVIAVFCLAFTLTQLMHWAIALVIRLLRLRGNATAGLVPKLAVCVVAACAIVWVGVRVQASLYPGTRPFYSENLVASESPFLRTEESLGEPLRHGLGLLGQFAIATFVAPFPGYSDFLIREYQLDYWSLSIEAAGPENWSFLQRVLASGVLLGLIVGAGCLRRADAQFAAPLLCVASQLGLHFFYGREYVLYSPHWHGLLVGIWVAAAWRVFAGSRPRILAISAGLGVALLANGVVVLDRVNREIAAGLEVEKRDGRGHLLSSDGSKTAPPSPENAVTHP